MFDGNVSASVFLRAVQSMGYNKFFIELHGDSTIAAHKYRLIINTIFFA